MKSALNAYRYRGVYEKELWIPRDLRTHPLREKRLLRKMERWIQKLGDSRFYQCFRDQIQTSSICEHIHEVLGSYSKMQMVIYGIGSFESKRGDNSRSQLSIALLMQRDFKCIGNIQIFDPILSATECRILEALGCSIISFDEEGFRKVSEPTFFFMPHCPAYLYDSVLQANWDPDLLSKIVILGSSFNILRKKMNPEIIMSLMSATKFTKEFAIKTNNPSHFLHNMSWEFFKIDQQFRNRLP